MGLRCLLGHDFDEPEIEREREEEGDEVVITVREVKTCGRCGERQVVSKNTEITSVEQLAGHAEPAAVAGDEPVDDHVAAGADGESPRDEADEAVAVDEGEPASASGTNAAGGDEPVDDVVATDAGEDDGVILDDDGATPDLEGAETTLEADPETATADEATVQDETDAAEETDAGEDDGVILDEEATAHEREREHGEWPDHDERELVEGDHGAWPEQRGPDEGYDAEITEGEADVSFGGGLTPERTETTPTEDDGEMIESEGSPVDSARPTGSAADPDATGTTAGSDGAEAADAASRDSDAASRDSDAASRDSPGAADADASGDERPVGATTGITRAGSPDPSTDAGDAATEFYCPECGLTRSAGRSSMRAGDICPECRKGYIDEHPK